MTYEEIIAALDAGKRVCWANYGYDVKKDPCRADCLEATFVANGYCTRLHPSEYQDCHIVVEDAPAAFKNESRPFSIDQYLETLLWSSTDLDGFPLDENKGLADVSAELRESSTADFKEFIRQVLATAADEFRAYLDKFDMKQVQRDFCLTRNAHGAGFWGRGIGKEFDKIAAIAERFPTVDPYIDPESGEIKA